VKLETEVTNHLVEVKTKSFNAAITAHGHASSRNISQCAFPTYAGFRLLWSDSDYAIMTAKCVSCHGQETCQDHMLLPDQSPLAVFNDMHDVIKKVFWMGFC